MWPEDFQSTNFPEHLLYVYFAYLAFWLMGFLFKMVLAIPALFVGDAYDPHDEN